MRDDAPEEADLNSPISFPVSSHDVPHSAVASNEVTAPFISWQDDPLNKIHLASRSEANSGVQEKRSIRSNSQPDVLNKKVLIVPAVLGFVAIAGWLMR